MDKDGSITIGNWQKGIATSPYLGFADVRNCEIHYPEGVLKIALAPTKISSTTVTALPTWMTAERSGSGQYYFGGYQDQNIYQFTQGTNIVSTMTSAGIHTGTGGGLFYKNKLIVTDIFGGSGNSDSLLGYQATPTPTWTNLGTLDTLDTGDTTPMYWAQDDSVYIGAGRYLDKFTAQEGWNPTSSGTYTAVTQGNGLDLPLYYKIESVTGLGAKLYVGASKRQSGSVIQDSFEGKFFPWDTTSPSFTFPIVLDKGGVKQSISRNGTIIFANGRKGNFVLTNGSATQDLPDIGLLRNNPQNVEFAMYPEAKEFVNGEYLFGISNDPANIFTPAGVYGYRNGAWRFLEISTGNDGTSGSVVGIGTILKRDDTNFYVGWQDGSSYGIDSFGESNYRYTNYRARVDTQLYKVGSVINPHQFNKVDITLAKPLNSGEGVRLSYRNNLSDTWTVMGTYDYATYGAVDSFQDGAQMEAVNNVQFRIELTTGTNSTTSPELLAVVIS